MTGMRISVLALAFMVAACSPSSTAGSTSTTDSAASSSTSTTATTVATTTTTPSTTTTVPATTTTIPPTTSTSVLEGNWAGTPLVAYGDWGGMALGWWDGDSWVQVQEGTELPVSGGEDYQVALLGSGGTVVGESPGNEGCDLIVPEGFPSVSFDDPEALVSMIGDGSGGERRITGVAISAPWPVTPRPVSPGEAHPDFEATAIDLLDERGYDTDRVELVQAIDVDLDGDGAIETLIVAEETELANEASDVYSIVFAVSPSWDGPRVIAESVIPADETSFPASFRVSAAADLSGDGKMEVVLDGLAWESGWVSVHELTDTGLVERLQAGCGV